MAIGLTPTVQSEIAAKKWVELPRYRDYFDNLFRSFASSPHQSHCICSYGSKRHAQCLSQRIKSFIKLTYSFEFLHVGGGDCVRDLYPLASEDVLNSAFGPPL